MPIFERFAISKMLLNAMQTVGPSEHRLPQSPRSLDRTDHTVELCVPNCVPNTLVPNCDWCRAADSAIGALVKETPIRALPVAVLRLLIHVKPEIELLTKSQPKPPPYMHSEAKKIGWTGFISQLRNREGSNQRRENDGAGGRSSLLLWSECIFNTQTKTCACLSVWWAS